MVSDLADKGENGSLAPVVLLLPRTSVYNTPLLGNRRILSRNRPDRDNT